MSNSRISRRTVAKGVVGFGALAAASQILEACKTRRYDSGIQQGLSDAEVTKGNFVDQWMKIANLDDNPQNPSRDTIAAFTFLAAAWFRRRPEKLAQELRELDIDILIGSTSGPVIAVGHEAVTQLLNDPARLGVTRYEREMKFLLGRYILCDADYENKHNYEKTVQSNVLSPNDKQLIQKLVTETILPSVKKDLPNPQEIDVVQDVIRKVAIRTAGLYIGIPANQSFDLQPDQFVDCMLNYPTLTSNVTFTMDEPTMYQWASVNFQNLFLNLSGEKTVQANGRKFGLQLLSYIAKVVDARKKELKKSPRLATDTMLDRLILLEAEGQNKLFFEVESIPNGKAPVYFYTDTYRNGTKATCQINSPDAGPFNTSQMFDRQTWRIVASLAGAYTGAIATVEEAFTNIIFVLLSGNDTSAYDAAKKAAGKDAASEDFEKLVTICREALRFRPQAEIVPREVLNNTGFEGSQLVKTTDSQGNETVVAQKSTVQVSKSSLALLSTFGASQDTRADSTLGQFKADRTGSDYFMEFGNQSDTFPGGEKSHQCLGKTMALVELAHTLGWFLRLGSNHTLVDNAIVFQRDFDGADSPFPERLRVKLT